MYLARRFELHLRYHTSLKWDISTSHIIDVNVKGNYTDNYTAIVIVLLPTSFLWDKSYVLSVVGCIMHRMKGSNCNNRKCVLDIYRFLF